MARGRSIDARGRHLYLIERQSERIDPRLERIVARRDGIRAKVLRIAPKHSRSPRSLSIRNVVDKLQAVRQRLAERAAHVRKRFSDDLV